MILLFSNEKGRKSLVRGKLCLRTAATRRAQDISAVQSLPAPGGENQAAAPACAALTPGPQPPRRAPGLLAAQNVRTCGRTAEDCCLPSLHRSSWGSTRARTQPAGYPLLLQNPGCGCAPRPGWKARRHGRTKSLFVG